MHRILVICILPFACHTVAAVAASPDNNFVRNWSAAVSIQVEAAEAEQTLQRLWMKKTTRQQRSGAAPAEELQQAREMAVQAGEWALVLRQHQQTIAAVPPNPTPFSSATEIRLRIPGVPAVFVDDKFAFVPVMRSHQSLQLAQRIARYSQDLHELTIVPTGASTALPSSGRQAHPLQKLYQRADLLNLPSLELLLQSPIQFLSPKDINRPNLRTTITHNWLTVSRQTMLTQVTRERALRSQTEDQQASGTDSPVEASLKSLDRVIKTLQREIHILKTVESPIPAGRSAHNTRTARHADLMRLTKDAHAQIQQELLAATEYSARLAAQIQSLSVSGIAADINAVQLVQLRQQSAIAEARRKCLMAAEQRSRSVVRLAMALYRYHAGHDSDSTILSDQISQVFRLATDFEADVELLDLQEETVRQQLAAIAGLAETTRQEQTSILESELQRLAMERQRCALRMKIGRSCQQLFELANQTDAFAIEHSRQPVEHSSQTTGV